MKAMVQTAFGSPAVLKLQEVDKPAVGDDDVLVRIHAASINAGDWFQVSGRPIVIRLAMPAGRVIGWDLAGRVEEVGGNVTRFKPGDEVFGEAGKGRSGSFAEYACTTEDRLAPKPRSLSLQQAAAIPVAGVTALVGLRDVGRLQAGERALINNASGGVGSFAVQIAKALGAEVAGVCSTRNLDLVRSLGADHVVDYTYEDFTKGAARYDLILDNIGSHAFWHYRRVLTPRGRIVPNTGHAGMRYVLKAFVLSALSSRQSRMFTGTVKSEHLLTLSEMIQAGAIRPVIDRVYSFEETPVAIGYVGERHVRGKVVIAVQGEA